MMIRRIFLVCLGLFLAPLCLASNLSQDLTEVRAAVEHEVSQYLRGIYGEEKFQNDIRVRVASIDTRLRLAACEQKITATVKETSYSAKSLSVKTQCLGSRQWTIYVPVNVDIFTQVAVSARNLHRGETVAPGDFVFKRTNTSNIAQSYLDTPEQLLGKELRRALRSGSVIKKQDLKEPTMISKGETVVIIARAGALEVKSEATALSNGLLGQQIKVQNQKSKRIVDARVTGRGTAEILL